MPSKIEWCDETINPVIGCTKCSPGCDNCYAERFANRLARNHKLGLRALDYQLTVEDGAWSGELAFDLKCFDKLPKKPASIFLASMGDIFHEKVPFYFIAALWRKMAKYPQHQFLLLTKRAGRMKEMMAALAAKWAETVSETPRLPLPNVWLGVTVCDQAEADEKVPLLMSTPAARRFLSIEPILGAVDLVGWGDIRQGLVAYPDKWADFDWPSWVPGELRKQVESFWSDGEVYRRSPRQWAANAVQNCGGIQLGAVVGLDDKFYKNSTVVRPKEHPDNFFIGRFIHMWNNICCVVAEDGSFHWSSYGGRWYLSEYMNSKGGYQRLIDAVIVGGETGAGARPMHPGWVRSIRAQCKEEKVPFFFKGWGEWGELQLYPDRPAKDAVWLKRDGSSLPLDGPGNVVEYCPMGRYGRKSLFRMLDGVEHNARPW